VGLSLSTHMVRSIGISSPETIRLRAEAELTSLILYHNRTRRWKIADFGLVSEGTSRKWHTTQYSRGTLGYRAPELVNDDAKYNKVDIWALGSILYELTFQRKGFNNDVQVALFHIANSNKTKSEENLTNQSQFLSCINSIRKLNADTRTKTRLSEFIRAILDINPENRPSAPDLLKAIQEEVRCPFGDSNGVRWPDFWGCSGGDICGHDR